MRTERTAPAWTQRARVGVAVLTGFLAGAMLEELLIGWLGFPTLDGLTWARSHASWAHTHPFTIIPLAVIATAGLIALLFAERGVADASRRFVWVGAASALATGLVTGALMFPLNLDIFAWAQAGALPEGWEATRDRWTALQAVRTLTAGTGFTALVFAAAARRTSG